MKLSLLSCSLACALLARAGARETIVGTANHYLMGMDDEEDRRPLPCTINEEVIAVRWSQEAASYVAVQVDDDGEIRRHLRGGESTEDSIFGLFDAQDDEWTAAIQVSVESGSDRFRRELEEQQETPTFIVRACNCEDLDPVFCPVGLDICRPVGQHSDNTTMIGCFDAEKRMAEVSQTSLFIAIVWFTVLCWCIACAPIGRAVIHYVLDKAYPGHSERLVDDMLEHHRHQAFLLLQRSVYHNRWLHRRFDEAPTAVHPDDDIAGPLTSLALKTHVFQVDPEASQNPEGLNDDGENLDTQCIICFQQLQNGDRAGDLLCGHTFHADCLKTWLKRRNVCPLCNATDVAQLCNKPARPRAQTVSTASEEDGASIVGRSNLVLRDGTEGSDDQEPSDSASA